MSAKQADVPRLEPPPRKLLVIQLRRIGDVLMATPAVAALKRRFPAARLDFLVEPPADEVLAGNPHIAAVLVYRCGGWRDYLSWLWRVRRERYDLVVDFMGNPRSAFLTAASGASVRAGPAHVGHCWAYNLRMEQSSVTHYAGREKIRLLKGLGVCDEGAPFLPELYLGAGESSDRPGSDKPAYARPSPDGPVAFAPASRKATRRWPAKHYIELGKQLRRRLGCGIVVLYGPGEKELADEIANGIGEGASAPATRTLREAAARLAGCRLLVTNCNGLKHIAVALGVPTVTLHGSSDPASWTPPDPRHLALRREDIPCVCCGLNDCVRELECLEGLPPAEVFEAALRLDAAHRGEKS